MTASTLPRLTQDDLLRAKADVGVRRIVPTPELRAAAEGPRPRWADPVEILPDPDGKRYNPNQRRDEHGRWARLGGGTDADADRSVFSYQWEKTGHALYLQDKADPDLAQPWEPPSDSDVPIAVPGVTVNKAQGWAAATYHSAKSYDAIQAAARHPERLPEIAANPVNPYAGDKFYGVRGEQHDRKAEDAAAELVRERLHLHEAIVEHGTNPPPGLVRVTGMEWIPDDLRARLDEGETVFIQDSGFLAATHDVAVAESIAKSTAIGAPAVWDISTTDDVRAFNNDTEDDNPDATGLGDRVDEWLFAPGTRMGLTKTGPNRYHVSITGPPPPLPA